MPSHNETQFNRNLHLKMHIICNPNLLNKPLLEKEPQVQLRSKVMPCGMLKQKTVSAVETKGFTSAVSARLTCLVVSCLRPSFCCVVLVHSNHALKSKGNFDEFSVGE